MKCQASSTLAWPAKSIRNSISQTTTEIHRVIKTFEKFLFSLSTSSLKSLQLSFVGDAELLAGVFSSLQSHFIAKNISIDRNHPRDEWLEYKQSWVFSFCFRRCEDELSSCSQDLLRCSNLNYRKQFLSFLSSHHFLRWRSSWIFDNFLTDSSDNDIFLI